MNKETADELDQELFAFNVEDFLSIEGLTSAVRRLLRRSDVTPEQIHGLAKLLLALESFPAPTPKVHVDLDCVTRHANGESESQGIRLSPDEFALDRSAYIIMNPSIGGDSQSEAIFSCFLGGGRSEVAPFALHEWVERFTARVEDPEQEIILYADCADDGEIDWNPDTDPDLWENLPSDF